MFETVDYIFAAHYLATLVLVRSLVISFEVGCSIPVERVEAFFFSRGPTPRL